MKININSQTHSIIKQHAVYEWRETAVKLPDGNFEISVDEELYNKIKKLQLPNETDNETLQRIIKSNLEGDGKINSMQKLLRGLRKKR